MFDKLFEPAKKVFGIIGASATGITAVFYVFGFLVVQQHYSFLGLTHISIDLNNYLFAGGRFFAYFPVLLIHLIDRFLEYFSLFPQRFISGFLILLVLSLLSRNDRVHDRFERTAAFFYKHIQKRLGLYLFLTNGLFLWLFLTYSLELVTEENWLFKNISMEMPWLIATTNDASATRQAIYATLLLIGILAIAWLVFLESIRVNAKKEQNQLTATTLRLALIFSALFLLILQVLYLPVNFGILIYSKEYPVIQFELNNSDIIPQLAEKPKVSLLHREKDDLYIYALREKCVWQIKRGELKWLTRMGRASVFDSRVFESDITRKE